MLHAGSIAFAVLPDGSSARAAGCGPAFLDGGCGYDLGELKRSGHSCGLFDLHCLPLLCDTCLHIVAVVLLK